jgi:hypothetical protein
MIKISKINNYQEINKQLIFLINKIPNNPLVHGNDNILHTDWNLPEDFKKEYVEYFLNIIKPYMLKMASELKCKKCEIDRIWFQQYNKNNTHQWHTHTKCQFTNIYFVKLPSKSLGTEILDQEKLNLNEGDLLSFPSYLHHRSPINLSNELKIIISFNSNFEEYFNGVDDAII